MRAQVRPDARIRLSCSLLRFFVALCLVLIPLQHSNGAESMKQTAVTGEFYSSSFSFIVIPICFNRFHYNHSSIYSLLCTARIQFRIYYLGTLRGRLIAADFHLKIEIIRVKFEFYTYTNQNQKSGSRPAQLFLREYN